MNAPRWVAVMACYKMVKSSCDFLVHCNADIIGKLGSKVTDHIRGDHRLITATCIHGLLLKMSSIIKGNSSYLCSQFCIFFGPLSPKFNLLVRGLLGVTKVLGILCHQGVQLILAPNWARPAILIIGMGECFYFFCFFTFIPVPLSSLSLSFISSTVSSVSFLPFSGRRHKMTHKGLTCRSTQSIICC